MKLILNLIVFYIFAFTLSSCYVSPSYSVFDYETSAAIGSNIKDTYLDIPSASYSCKKILSAIKSDTYLVSNKEGCKFYIYTNKNGVITGWKLLSDKCKCRSGGWYAIQ